MEIYSLSQMAKRIPNASNGNGRGNSTKGGSVEELNQKGCNHPLVVTPLANARVAPQL